MERIFIGKTPDYEGKSVKVSGWVHSRRDHGKIIFIDLRDRSGILQVVFAPQLGEAYEKAGSLRSEWVVSIEGKINARPKGMQNPALKTGLIEMAAEKIEILNPAETPPFFPDTDGYEINEENRLKYRYIDLRRPRLSNNIKIRHKMIKHIRDYLDAEDFYEIETPDSHKINARRGKRLRRAFALASGKILRIAASASTIQTTFDGIGN